MIDTQIRAGSALRLLLILVLVALGLLLAATQAFAGSQSGARQAKQPDQAAPDPVKAPAVAASVTACPPRWVALTSENTGSVHNVLRGIAAASATDVWAVGYYDNGAGASTLVEHWDGTQWSAVPSPNAGGGAQFYSSYLYSVSVSAHNDVWAVGNYRYAPDPNNPSYGTLTEHWDGTAWRIVTSPTMGHGSSTLSGVAAVSGNSVWAVGSFGFYAQPEHTLIEHWNGNAWSIVPSPDPGLAGDVYLNSVAAVSATDIWAVGNYNNGATNVELFEHYDGSAWTIVPGTGARPFSTSDYLRGAAAVATNDVWAVGYRNSGGPNQTLVERWNGGSWNVISSPNDASGSVLNGVSAVSANDIWAVGSTGAGQTFTTHWNGTQWSAVAGANPGANGNSLNGVQSISSSNVWAVGAATVTAQGQSQALVENYTDSFSDVPEGSSFYPYVKCLACLGIISGYQGNLYRPNNNVTRGQAAKILANSAGYNDQIPSDRQTFEDVPPTNPFWLFVERVALHGAINGYQCGQPPAGQCVPPGNKPYFLPSNNVTRGQLAKIDSTAAGYADNIPSTQQSFEDVAPNSTFWVYIERVYVHGAINGYQCGQPPAGQCVPPGNRPYFLPSNNVTRGQIAKIAGNTFFPDCSPPAKP